jgi:hypothetical protein
LHNCLLLLLLALLLLLLLLLLWICSHTQAVSSGCCTCSRTTTRSSSHAGQWVLPSHDATQTYCPTTQHDVEQHVSDKASMSDLQQD